MVNAPFFKDASADSAGDGEWSYNDVFNIFRGISGLAGEAAQTVNSLTRDRQPNAAQSTPTFSTKFGDNKGLLYGGIAVVVAVLLFVVLKR